MNRILINFRHACKMVWRNKRSYLLLSVTVVLAFSFLLGYLMYTDSSLHNEYKEVLSRDRNVIYFYGFNGMKDSRMDIVLDKTQAAGTTQHYQMVFTTTYSHKLPLEEGVTDGLQTIPQCYFIPSQVWELYDFENHRSTQPLEIEWLDGQEHETIHLDSGQMLMERGLYELMDLDKQEDPTYYMRFTDLNNIESYVVELEVVGIVSTADKEWIQTKKDSGSWYSHPNVYLPISLLDNIPENIKAGMSFAWIDTYYTEAPEQAYATATSFDIYSSSTYRQQDAAIAQITSAKSNKAVIAAAMVVLLGICLYSCFTNALSDRKFEIGVKRAVGASSWSIIRQFLYESIVVMTADVFLSVVLVVDVAIIYKFILSLDPEMTARYGAYTIYISPYSMGMFGLCAVGLTVVFSLIFAYQSTQVQIVDYLKAE